MQIDFKLLEGHILERMRETRTPGLSISIVSDNQIVYSKGFGFSDIASGLAATPRTLYGIGSVTKSFTALAIMQLVGEGKVRLTDPVEKFVSGVPRVFDEPPTIHHLLTHSSGLPALGYGEAFMNGVLGIDNSWLPIANVEDVLTFMRDAQDWAVSKPGERFFYLNEGFAILGNVISKLSGMTYEEYVDRKILTPLAMDRTFFSKADVEKDNDKATPYIIDREGKHVVSSMPYGINSDGGIISNVLDLANYLRMCINSGEYEGKSIVDKKLFEAMVQAHIRLPYEGFGKDSYGYGWSVAPKVLGHKLVDHGGSVGVYTAYAGYMKDEKIGVAVLGNPSVYLPSNVGRFALAMLLGEDPETLPFTKRDRILEKLQGQYETYKGTMKINIKKKGDFLIAEIKDRYTEEVIPLVPEKLEEDHATFTTMSEGIKYTTEFTVKDGRTEWIYERYKARKKG